MHEEEQEEKNLADLLKQSIPPVHAELQRDLWPQMLRRLDEREHGRNWLARMFSFSALSSVPWFDWALLAILLVSVCAFPKSIPIWLYHF
jgi:hypothetical protein